MPGWTIAARGSAGCRQIMDENPPPRPARNTPPDPALRRLLNSWPVETDVTPAFARAVWRRIEARAAVSWTSPWERWVGWLTRHLEQREYALKNRYRQTTSS